jgi:hypothetical protein
MGKHPDVGDAPPNVRGSEPPVHIERLGEAANCFMCFLGETTFST